MNEEQKDMTAELKQEIQFQCDLKDLSKAIKKHFSIKHLSVFDLLVAERNNYKSNDLASDIKVAK